IHSLPACSAAIPPGGADRRPRAELAQDLAQLSVDMLENSRMLSHRQFGQVVERAQGGVDPGLAGFWPRYGQRVLTRVVGLHHCLSVELPFGGTAFRWNCLSVERLTGSRRRSTNPV